MSAAPSRQNSKKPLAAAKAAGGETAKEGEEVQEQESMTESQGSSLAGTPREKRLDPTPSLPALDRPPRSPRRNSGTFSDGSMKQTHLGSPRRRSPAAAAAAAAASRLQQALKSLAPWDSKQGKEEESQPRGPPIEAPVKGTSPPGFILTLTANWPGCQALCSFTAADLGPKVALWSVEAPSSPASFVFYDPKKKK
ncbi:hypothetical protein EBH_0052880 [Eimeria brunetti]|uniref:Uncharacterized protein n=1 Tax=Eimeria brunetti TaxID=51314 RepID=U6LW58_9EIME|nr:hypothetical protein EBH_0052880 [Eimeria brunetti]